MKSTINFGYLIFLSVVAALGGFLFGYDTAVISGTIAQVTQLFQLDTLQQGWYVGCALVGSIVGVLFAGILSDKLGRKLTMVISAVLFSTSALGCALSADFTQLVIYRIIGGVGIGVVSIVSPLYISEVAVAQYRGRLVSLYQLAVTVGFLGAYLVNYQLLAWAESGTQLSVDWLNKVFITEVWRGMLGMETLPAILFFIIIFFIPESPRWLIVRGKELKAVNILEKIYNSITEAKSQLKETKSVLTSETRSEWSLLMKPGIFKAVIIGVCIAILGQFMGVNAVLYYGPSIFENAGLSGGDSLFYQVLVGLVNTLTTVLALVIIDKVGRKKLVYYGRIHLCRGVRAPLGDVSHQGSRTGHVDSRIRSVDRNVPDRTVNPLDAPEPYPRRNILPVRPHVRAVYADCLETRAGDYREVAGRD